MLQEVIAFYEKELGAWNMIYKRMNRTLTCIYVVVVIGLLAIVIWSFYHQRLGYLFFSSSLIGLLLSILNEHNKRIIKKQYGIDVKEDFWAGPSFYKVRAEKLRSYLYDKNLKTEKQLQMLIDRLNKHSESKKFSGLFIPGLTMGLFLPLWNSNISWWYKNVQNYDQAISMFLSFLFTILIILVGTQMVKSVSFDFFNREANRIKLLATIVEDILLNHLSEKENSQ